MPNLTDLWPNIALYCILPCGAIVAVSTLLILVVRLYGKVKIGLSGVELEAKAPASKDPPAENKAPATLPTSGTTFNVSGDRPQINAGEGGRNVQTGTYIETLEQVLPPAPEAPPQPLLGSIPPLNAEVYIERGIETNVFAALRGNGVAAIVGLHAPGGVGKSELAKRALQELRQNFENVLWVDVGEKAASLLVPEMIGRCGQKPPESYPAQVQALQAIFSSHRYLVVLDDLRKDAKDQLQDFLPPAPPCAVLVTSRIQQPSHLIPLKNTFELDQMTPAQARELLAAALGEKMVAAEEKVFEAIAERCRYNALALEIAARRIRQMQGITTPAANYLGKLEVRGLRELQAEGGPRLNLSAVFDASYDDLAPADRKRFRALATFHPTGFSPEAAARVRQDDEAAAGQALRRLQNLSLAKIVPGEVERYRLHDLLDEYAAGKLQETGETGAAHAALAEWLIKLFDDHFTDDITAAPEVGLELNNLLRALDEAESHKNGDRMADLLRAGRNWLMLLLFDQWEQKARAAIRVGVSDTRLRANVLQAIGDVQQFRKEMDAALASYEEALRLFRAVGDKLGEANVRKAIGDVQQFRDDRDAALASYEEALRLFRAVGAKLGEANVLLSLAVVHIFQGVDDTKGADYLANVRQIYEAIHFRMGIAGGRLCIIDSGEY
jgi:tetratricopeptide (TPR) repeat protein